MICQIIMKSFLPFLFFYLVAGVVLVFAIAIWAFRDARRRGYSGLLIAILVFWTFPLGIILWLILRPELLPNMGSADHDAEIKHRANGGLL